MRILVVDDEKGFCEALKDNLEHEQYEADCASGGKQALDCLKAKKYDLIILDVMMPDIDGFDVLRVLRKVDKQIPVIFLTARSADEDKLKGLGLGADDYVTKPFNVLELMARVKSVLKRSAPGSDLRTLSFGNITVDFDRFVVKKGKKQTEIGRFEAEILRFLASKPGKVFSREEILDKIWGMDAFPTNRTIDNYIVKLRQKIESDPKNPQYLISVYGAGYKLSAL